MTAAECSLSRRRRGLSLAADDAFAPVAVSLWGPGAPAPTLATVTGEATGILGPGKESLHACVGSVSHGRAARRPRRCTGDGHGRRRCRVRHFGAHGPGAPVPRGCHLPSSPTWSSSSPTTCATTTWPTCRSRAACWPSRAWSSPTPSRPIPCAARRGPSWRRASTPRTTASSTTAVCTGVSRPSTPPGRRARGSVTRATARRSSASSSTATDPVTTVPPGGRAGTHSRGASTTTSTSP